MIEYFLQNPVEASTIIADKLERLMESTYFFSQLSIPSGWTVDEADQGDAFTHMLIRHACGHKIELWDTVRDPDRVNEYIKKLTKGHTCGSSPD